jgi:hypothetical protein
VWLGWGISLVLAIADVAKANQQEELENEPYDF